MTLTLPLTVPTIIWFASFSILFYWPQQSWNFISNMTLSFYIWSPLMSLRARCKTYTHRKVLNHTKSPTAFAPLAGHLLRAPKESTTGERKESAGQAEPHPGPEAWNWELQRQTTLSKSRHTWSWPCRGWQCHLYECCAVARWWGLFFLTMWLCVAALSSSDSQPADKIGQRIVVHIDRCLAMFSRTWLFWCRCHSIGQCHWLWQSEWQQH